jgi:hypothetical protein
MTVTLREVVSRRLLHGAAESAFDRLALERGLQAVPPHVRGRDEALAALGTARLLESAIIWLGWRLQPRNISWG